MNLPFIKLVRPVRILLDKKSVKAVTRKGSDVVQESDVFI